MLSILDTDTVVISPGMEGEQENALPWKYLIGWKLCLLMASVRLPFLSTIKTTIISTLIVSIAKALKSFVIKDLVITACLLAYTDVPLF